MVKPFEDDKIEEAPWMEITEMAPRNGTSYSDPCCCPVIPFASPMISLTGEPAKR